MDTGSGARVHRTNAIMFAQAGAIIGGCTTRPELKYLDARYTAIVSAFLKPRVFVTAARVRKLLVLLPADTIRSSLYIYIRMRRVYAGEFELQLGVIYVYITSVDPARKVGRLRH